MWDSLSMAGRRLEPRTMEDSRRSIIFNSPMLPLPPSQLSSAEPNCRASPSRAEVCQFQAGRHAGWESPTPLLPFPL